MTERAARALVRISEDRQQRASLYHINAMTDVGGCGRVDGLTWGGRVVFMDEACGQAGTSEGFCCGSSSSRHVAGGTSGMRGGN
jgi:hypothetical protein